MLKKIVIGCVSPLIAAVLASSLFAATGSERGDELCYWETHALVLARVLNSGRHRARVDWEKGPIATHYLTLDLKMCLAGSFDSVRCMQRKYDISLSLYGAVFANPPPDDALVLLVLESHKKGYFVSPSYQNFMPASRPVFEVEGIHDPQTTRSLESVKTRRRKSETLTEQEEQDCAHFLKMHTPEYIVKHQPVANYAWEKRSLVYAEVISKVVEPERARAQLKLKLIGTLAGTLDPALVGETLDVAENEKSLGKTKLFDIQETVFVCLAFEDGKYVLSNPEGEPIFADGPLFRCNKPTDDHCKKVIAALRKSFDAQQKLQEKAASVRGK